MNAPSQNLVIAEVEKRLPSFAAVLPPTIPAAKFVAAFKTMALNNPDVQRAQPRSVVIAVMQAAQDALLPDGRDAAIVVRNGVAQYQRMGQGLIKLLYRTGRVSSVSLQVVREGDEWDYAMGDDPYIQHKPRLSLSGDLIAAYSVVTMRDGTKDRCIMGYEEIERIMRMSPAGWDAKAQKPRGIWAKHPSEMWKKTVLHRHIKTLPLEGLPQPEAVDEVEAVEDAAWLEPEDYGSQPDSGAPTSRTRERFNGDDAIEAQERANDEAVNEALIEGEIVPESDDWSAKIYAFDQSLIDAADVETLEDTFNEWDAHHAEQPEWVQGQIAGVVQKHVGRIKAKSKGTGDYKRASRGE
jgi:recombination protein RecT